MRLIIITLLISSFMQAQDYNFSKKNQQNDSRWQVVNDVVMGGVSSSQYEFTPDGITFNGEVRLENNGGFCMLQFSPDEISTEGLTYIYLKVKAEPNRYQLRLKSSRQDNINYYQNFKTTGDWQVVKFALLEFEPQFRGRQLRRRNFNAASIAQISVLIGNKKRENFKIQLAEIWFE